MRAGTVAAHVLDTKLSTVNIAGTLQHARPSWVAVALLGSALTYFGAALARQAFAPVRVPLTRTARVQLASSFLTLVTPPAVGQISINIRYLQRAGAPTAAAAASVGVSEAVTVAVTLVVLLVCGWISGLSQSLLTLLPSGNVLAVLLVAVTVLPLVAAAPPTRRLLRHRLEPLVRGTLPRLIAAASDPRRLATAVVGVLVLNTGYVLALDASLRCTWPRRPSGPRYPHPGDSARSRPRSSVDSRPPGYPSGRRSPPCSCSVSRHSGYPRPSAGPPSSPSNAAAGSEPERTSWTSPTKWSRP